MAGESGMTPVTEDYARERDHVKLLDAHLPHTIAEAPAEADEAVDGDVRMPVRCWLPGTNLLSVVSCVVAPRPVPPAVGADLPRGAPAGACPLPSSDMTQASSPVPCSRSACCTIWTACSMSSWCRRPLAQLLWDPWWAAASPRAMVAVLLSTLRLSYSPRGPSSWPRPLLRRRTAVAA